MAVKLSPASLAFRMYVFTVKNHVYAKKMHIVQFKIFWVFSILVKIWGPKMTNIIDIISSRMVDKLNGMRVNIEQVDRRGVLLCGEDDPA